MLCSHLPLSTFPSPLNPPLKVAELFASLGGRSPPSRGYLLGKVPLGSADQKISEHFLNSLGLVAGAGLKECRLCLSVPISNPRRLGRLP